MRCRRALDISIWAWEFPSVYARSAGDDKGPIQAFVSAMDAIGGRPTQNIKVILHGEEEGGGPALDFVVQNHADKLRAAAPA